MPLYEYQCDACGNRFEQIQKFSDPPVDKCPKCGEGPVRKLMSSPAFQFKGSGWYVTDYARKDQPSAKSDAGSNGAGKEKPAPKDKSGKTSTTESSSSSTPTTASSSSSSETKSSS